MLDFFENKTDATGIPISVGTAFWFNVALVFSTKCVIRCFIENGKRVMGDYTVQIASDSLYIVLQHF